MTVDGPSLFAIVVFFDLDTLVSSGCWGIIFFRAAAARQMAIRTVSLGFSRRSHRKGLVEVAERREERGEWRRQVHVQHSNLPKPK
uniref:Uncharacterized protein n=1 Tax=Nelumbo nucifera TaxID=4432 RepID=A0A822YC54_NELNU|nr:TPA_asm: hypothetical protein HUJ06_030053 [Nelumbo nucifera]